MWAVYALEAHRAIDADTAKVRLAHLAERQRTIRYGRSAGWLAPPWWGDASVHREHQRALIDRDQTRYSAEVFERGSFREPSAMTITALDV